MDEQVKSGQLLVLRMGNYPLRQMNHKLANDMKMFKRNGTNNTLLFYPNGLEILQQERRGQVKTIVMNTSMASSSTIPDLLTSSIPINQSYTKPSIAS